MKTFQEFPDVDQKLFQQEELILEATELLATIMAENQVTKADLARRLRKSKAFITQCLNGGQNLTLRTLADLFGALGYRLQLGAAPGAQQAQRKIIKLYSVGGWAIERATESLSQRILCEEPADVSRALFLCEAA
jgi:transcriptional regulator with XRE-family HTH domain